MFYHPSYGSVGGYCFIDWLTECNGSSHLIIECRCILVSRMLVFALRTWMGTSSMGPTIKGNVGPATLALWARCDRITCYGRSSILQLYLLLDRWHLLEELHHLGHHLGHELLLGCIVGQMLDNFLSLLRLWLVECWLHSFDNFLDQVRRIELGISNL